MKNLENTDARENDKSPTSPERFTATPFSGILLILSSVPLSLSHARAHAHTRTHTRALTHTQCLFHKNRNTCDLLSAMYEELGLKDQTPA